MKQSSTRIGAVMAQVQSRIASRAYMPGTRLPSVRAQAQAMRLSVSTVVEAYERLAAAGVAEVDAAHAALADPGAEPVAGHLARVLRLERAERASSWLACDLGTPRVVGADRTF